MGYFGAVLNLISMAYFTLNILPRFQIQTTLGVTKI